MKKKALLTTIFMILICIPAFSNIKLEKVALIDLERIMETVFSGKSSSVKSIQEKKAKLQKNLDALKARIVKYEEQRLKTKSDEKKKEYTDKIDKLKKTYSDYYKVENYKIQQMIKNVQDPIFKEIYGVVKRIAESEGYTIVLDKKSDGIFYYSVDIEITDKVIEYFEEHYGEEKEE